MNKIVFATLLISGSIALGLFGAIDPFDLIADPVPFQAEMISTQQFQIKAGKN